MANYIRYANSGAGRNQPLDPKLVEALSYLGDMGITAEVFSGGVGPNSGKLSKSGRHVHGGAGDMRFYQGDRQLDWSNKVDIPIFEQIVRQGKERGITGFGAGPGYMGPGTMHVGFGKPAVWGAGGQGANAPEWLRNAYYGGSGGQPSTIPGTTLAGAPSSGGSGKLPPDLIEGVMAAADGTPAPKLPPPIDVKTHNVAGVQEPAMSDKIGTALWGDKAEEFKNLFGEGAKPNPASKGLGLLAGAMGGGGGQSQQEREHATPIQSSLPAMEASDAQRISAGQQMMAMLMANRKKPGLSLGRA